jgi:hypothetical protein
MLTFFTTAKPFVGHDGVIQRNALASWKLLHPDVEVILFGDEEGAAETCERLNLVHETRIERHKSGKPLVDPLFQRAQERATHKYICYSNCDIILMQDFRIAFERAKAWQDSFLMVSRRWDLDILSPIDFENGGWSSQLREHAVTAGFRQDECWIDFFLFPRGQYKQIPKLVVGHCYWDNWMIWRTLQDEIPVLDASPCVVPVHQNHGYDPKFGRSKGRPTDALSQSNLEAIGGQKHVRRIDCATHRLRRNGKVRRIWIRNTYAMREKLTYSVWLPAWHRLLGVTRPLRSVLGLRRTSERSDVS